MLLLNRGVKHYPQTWRGFCVSMCCRNISEALAVAEYSGKFIHVLVWKSTQRYNCKTRFSLVKQDDGWEGSFCLSKLLLQGSCKEWTCCCVVLLCKKVNSQILGMCTLTIPFWFFITSSCLVYFLLLFCLFPWSITDNKVNKINIGDFDTAKTCSSCLCLCLVLW